MKKRPQRDLSALLKRPARGKKKEPQKPANDLETGCKEQLGKVERSFRDRMKTEKKRFRKATDSEFWACIVFQSRQEKERFLRAAGLFHHGDKYLDGHVVAKTLGIDMAE